MLLCRTPRCNLSRLFIPVQVVSVGLYKVGSQKIQVRNLAHVRNVVLCRNLNFVIVSLLQVSQTILLLCRYVLCLFTYSLRIVRMIVFIFLWKYIQAFLCHCGQLWCLKTKCLLVTFGLPRFYFALGEIKQPEVEGKVLCWQRSPQARKETSTGIRHFSCRACVTLGNLSN